MKSHYGKGIRTRAFSRDKQGNLSPDYLSPHGAKDPVARLISQIELDIILDFCADPENIATSISGFYEKNFDRFPSLHRYPTKFLIDIQKWHDNEDHWGDKGVNDLGWEALNSIKSKIERMQR